MKKTMRFLFCAMLVVLAVFLYGSIFGFAFDAYDVKCNDDFYNAVNPDGRPAYCL